MDNPNPTNDEEVNKQILQHEKSAAGILCQLRIHHGAQASHLTLTKDVVGIVATLGKVEDDNLSRYIWQYFHSGKSHTYIKPVITSLFFGISGIIFKEDGK